MDKEKKNAQEIEKLVGNTELDEVQATLVEILMKDENVLTKFKKEIVGTDTEPGRSAERAIAGIQMELDRLDSGRATASLVTLELQYMIESSIYAMIGRGDITGAQQAIDYLEGALEAGVIDSDDTGFLELVYTIEDAQVKIYNAARAKKPVKTQRAIVKRLVRSADMYDVRGFLTEVFCKNPHYFEEFKKRINASAPSNAIQAQAKAIERIDKIVKQYESGRLGTYESPDAFTTELSVVLDVYVKPMIEHGDFSEAFVVLGYVFDITENVDIDESDGGYDFLVCEIKDYWIRILDAAPTTLKRNMLNWFTTHEVGKVTDWPHDAIDEMIAWHFEGPQFYRPLAEYRKQLALHPKYLGRSDFKDENLKRYLKSIANRKNVKERIREVIAARLDVPWLWTKYVDSYVNKKDYEAALDILNDCLSKSDLPEGLRLEMSEKREEVLALQEANATD